MATSPKAAKTWLIVKEDKLEEAKHIFKDTGVKITSDGMRHLGAAIGAKTKRQLRFTEDSGMDRQRRATGQNCSYGATSSLFSLH